MNKNYYCMTALLFINKIRTNKLCCSPVNNTIVPLLITEKYSNLKFECSILVSLGLSLGYNVRNHSLTQEIGYIFIKALQASLFKKGLKCFYG